MPTPSPPPPGHLRWPRLFSPLRIGGLELPNRIVLPAMDPSLASPDGAVTDAMIRHYRDRAQGGAGLLVTGNIACELRGRISPRMPLISDDRFVPGLSRLCDAVHDHGGRIFLQISHGGRQTLSVFAQTQPVSASPIACPVMRDPPRALADEEIEGVADAFAAAAVRAQQAGADGVEFHMAHGYLVCQFLSPYSNHRLDRWGTDVEGRSRLAVEIVRRTLSLCGADFPIQCRLSADERVEGGIVAELAIEYARRLVDAGAHAISVSACNYESYRFNMPCYYLPKATYAPLAKVIRDGIEAAVPVIAVGRFGAGDLAEAALRNGEADLVAMGRALIADPDLPHHLAADNEAAIRPCVACNRCAESVTKGPLRCLVNPEAGRADSDSERVATPRKVVVIGGGPSGLVAAVEAARRGHAVRLFEAEARLAGKVWAGGSAPLKEAFGDYARWLVRSACEMKLPVELNRRVEPKDLVGPDLGDAELVLVAVGAVPRDPPPIEGLEPHPTVMHPEQALVDSVPRQHVLIIGGGAEGCEMADAMAHRSDRPKVTLVELRPKIGLGLPTSVRSLLEARVVAAGVEVLRRTTVRAIHPDRVLLADRRGRPAGERPAADLVVLCVGVRVPDGWAAVAASDPRVKLLGDARSPATILEAVEAGWRAGRAI